MRGDVAGDLVWCAGRLWAISRLQDDGKRLSLTLAAGAQLRKTVQTDLVTTLEQGPVRGEGKIMPVYPPSSNSPSRSGSKSGSKSGPQSEEWDGALRRSGKPGALAGLLAQQNGRCCYLLEPLNAETAVADHCFEIQLVETIWKPLLSKSPRWLANRKLHAGLLAAANSRHNVGATDAQTNRAKSNPFVAFVRSVYAPSGPGALRKLAEGYGNNQHMQRLLEAGPCGRCSGWARVEERAEAGYRHLELAVNAIVQDLEDRPDSMHTRDLLGLYLSLIHI
jgi:hypothetical protein